VDPWIVAITGATGSVYAKRLIETLRTYEEPLCLVISGPGRRVVKDELGWVLTGDIQNDQELIRGYCGYRPDEDGLSCFDWQDIGCCLASGSFRTRGMFVVPCTMATLAGIAAGTSSNLIERAADVVIKERRRLVMVPRETPLSPIHLRNMLALAEMGVCIAPPMPAFYFRPKSLDDLVDFFVKRVLALAGFETETEGLAW
jgi:4-hydroxy-3-polyprenylbenzoate decarboxylase